MVSKKEWVYMHTEEYIREKEQEEIEWNSKNKNQEKVYLEKIEKVLKTGTREAREELLTIFRDKDFIETYKSETRMAYFIVIMQIYEREVEAEETRTILDIGGSYEELKKKFLELKFALWRIEFVKDLQAQELLLEYIYSNRITPIMLQFMVYTVSADKVEVLMQLSDIFMEQNMFRYAFCMLEYLDELLPGNETVLCILADLCGKAGRTEQAAEYLNKIEEPGRMTEGIRKKYGC